MEHLFNRSLELGAQKAKVIDTDSVLVGEWVRWKCVYGFPSAKRMHPRPV
jgi:predicted metal-binding protein